MPFRPGPPLMSWYTGMRHWAWASSPPQSDGRSGEKCPYHDPPHRMTHKSLVYTLIAV